MDKNKELVPTPMPERWKQEWEHVCKLLLKKRNPSCGNSRGIKYLPSNNTPLV